MLLYFVLLLKNVFHSQYIPYVSYFHIYVFLFCDDELYMLKSNKTSVLFCSITNLAFNIYHRFGLSYNRLDRSCNIDLAFHI